MKKNIYSRPELEVVKIDTKDIMALSPETEGTDDMEFNF